MRTAAAKRLGLGLAMTLGLVTAALAADERVSRGQGPMGPGMMQGQGSPGMMGPDMEAMWSRHHAMHAREGHGPHGGGLLGLEGHRVVPVVRLSADDVQLWLEAYLEQVGNPRLKVGTVEEADDATVRAEIVTVDDSLVESLVVDRRTGRITSGG